MEDLRAMGLKMVRGRSKANNCERCAINFAASNSKVCLDCNVLIDQIIIRFLKSENDNLFLRRDLAQELGLSNEALWHRIHRLERKNEMLHLR